MEGFDTPPRVALRPVVDVISADEDGLIEFAMANPRRNRVNLEVELVLRVPSGIHIYSSDVALAGPDPGGDRAARRPAGAAGRA